MTPHEEARSLAAELMRLARSTLLTELRFLSPALCRMPLIDDAACLGMATDGQGLRYQYVYALRRWQADRASVPRALLHMVLHCVYRHPFIDDGALLPACWDLACDIAVENAIDALSLPALRVERDDEAGLLLAELNRALNGKLTAERVYRHFADSGLSESRLEQLRLPFQRDDHGLWYQRSRRKDDAPRKRSEADESDPRDGDSPESGNRRGPGKRDAAGHGREAAAPEDGGHTGGSPAPEAISGEWRRIAAQVQADLETHSREWSDRAGSMLLNLREGRRTRRSFAEFLRRFAVLTEVPEADLDSWDNLLYAYGMSLYRNMPLIEPLEYSEKNRVRSLVIVIDTSGSVQGDRIQAFLETACGLLLSGDAYDRRTVLHVIECDAKVQRDTRIETREEIQAFCQTLQLHGGGGTDFRPAFEHIEALQADGALAQLRGILYLTDGDGTYPSSPPRCDTAFLFVNREDVQTRVPPWAMRVLLDARTLDRPEVLYYQ